MAKSDLFLMTAALLLLVIGVMRLDSVDLFDGQIANRANSSPSAPIPAANQDTARVSISTNSQAASASTPTLTNDAASDATIIIEASSSARPPNAQPETRANVGTETTVGETLPAVTVAATALDSGSTISTNVVSSIESTDSNSVSSTESRRLHMYTIKPGDSLSKLAIQFEITEQELREINLLEDSVIHVGHTLLYPVKK